MRKIFTFLFAALMSVGMYAATEVTITDSDFPASGDSFTKDGVTVSAVEIDGMYGDISGPGSFSTTLGNFTKIEIFAEDVSTISGEGWSGGGSQKIWTGNASSVSFTGSINGYEEGTTLKFTIEPASAVPAWVKSGDEWDDATKTLTVNGNPVSNAYIGVSDIENLVISDAVTSIGDNAFEDCNGLKSVVFGSSLASIGKEAFSSCIKLESVTFPASLQSIGKKAFLQCYALTSVTITNGLTSIEQQAFFNCEKLTSVTIPSSVTDIGSSAFGNCKVLTGIVVAAENPNYSSADGVLFDKAKTTLIQCPGGKQGEYTIPNSVTSIGNNAFASCNLLTSVEIPNSVGEIGSQAFSSCIELTSVTIGNGVTSIGGYAFYYSSKLASVTINATTPPTLGGSALDKTAAALTIYVPAASVTDYKGAWTAYADKIEAIPAPEPIVAWNEIAFTEVVGANDLSEDAVFKSGGFEVAITDPDNKMSIDANDCRFGSATDYKMYSHRLKTGGKSSSAKNFMTLTIPEDGVLRLAVRTGSNSATDRNLVIKQDEKTLYDEIIQESMLVKVMEGDNEVSVYPFVEVAVKAGTVTLTYPVNGLNFYSFAVPASEEPEPQFAISYGEDKWLNIVPADAETPYFLWLDSKTFYDGKYTEYTQEKMGGYMDYNVALVNDLNMIDLFLLSGEQKIAPNALLASQGSSPFALGEECLAFVFKYDTTDKKRASDVEYFVFTYAGEPDQDAVENISVDAKAVKLLRDGMLLIEKNGKFYNITGVEVK